LGTVNIGADNSTCDIRVDDEPIAQPCEKVLLKQEKGAEGSGSPFSRIALASDFRENDYRTPDPVELVARLVSSHSRSRSY
jgi:hypothetical protein